MAYLSIFFQSSYCRLGTSIFRWDIVWADPYPKSEKKLTGINHKCYLNVIFVDFETDFCSIVLTKNILTSQYLLVDKNLFKV